MADFLLYEGRHGERLLVEKTQAGWDFLVQQLEQDDGSTLEESDAYVEGSYEEGRLFVDDGGRIDTISLTIPT